MPDSQVLDHARTSMEAREQEQLKTADQSETIDDIMPRRWGDVEGYWMTDAEGEGKGPVDLPVQSQIACSAMRDSRRSTMESRGKRVRKHRAESASADDSEFLFRSEQIEGTKTRTGTGLRSERTFPGDRLHEKYRPNDVAAVLGRGNIVHL